MTPERSCGTASLYLCNGRAFNDSSFKTLTSATSPESGSISYTYDPNGTLHTQTAGGVTMTDSYDALEESIGKTYSDSTRSASYSYNYGWRTSASSGNTTYSYTAFDCLGRVTGATQTTDGASYPFSYLTPSNGSGYNLIEGVTSMTMPLDRTLPTNYDPWVGRTGSAAPMERQVVYCLGSHGAPTQLTLGNTLSEYWRGR